MDEEKFDKQVDDLTLALIYLNRCKKKDDIGWRAWKNYPFFAMDQLEEQDMINQGSHKSRSLGLTDAGIRKAKELLAKWNLQDPWADDENADQS